MTDTDTALAEGARSQEKAGEVIPLPYDWKTSPQTARILGVHVNFLLGISPKQLPYYLVGRNRRYLMSDIEAYLDTIKVQS